MVSLTQFSQAKSAARKGLHTQKICLNGKLNDGNPSTDLFHWLNRTREIYSYVAQCICVSTQSSMNEWKSITQRIQCGKETTDSRIRLHAMHFPTIDKKLRTRAARRSVWNIFHTNFQRWAFDGSSSSLWKHFWASYFYFWLAAASHHLEIHAIFTTFARHIVLWPFSTITRISDMVFSIFNDQNTFCAFKQERKNDDEKPIENLKETLSQMKFY